MKLTDVEYGDEYYATVDGAEITLSYSEYHSNPENADRVPCQKCDRLSEDAEKLAIYTSDNDVWLCRECLESCRT